MNKFTNTILQNIFSLLERKHINGENYALQTLYFCSLVNRKWNQNAISYLWSSPFHSQKNPSGYTSFENSNLTVNLMNIYLECLDNYSLKILKEHQILVVEKPRSSSLLHNYLKFLKYLNLRGLVDCIGIWLSNSSNKKRLIFPYQIRKAQLVILKELIRNAVENGAALNELRIDMVVENEFYDEFEDEKYLEWLSHTPGLLAFPRHMSLICYPEQRWIPFIVAQKCKNLISLEIEFFDSKSSNDFKDNHEMNQIKSLWEDLLRYQNELRHLTIIGNAIAIDTFLLIIVVINSLTSLSHCLSFITFINIDFAACPPLESLKSLNELKKITLINCYNFNSSIKCMRQQLLN